MWAISRERLLTGLSDLADLYAYGLGHGVDIRYDEAAYRLLRLDVGSVGHDWRLAVPGSGGRRPRTLLPGLLRGLALAEDEVDVVLVGRIDAESR